MRIQLTRAMWASVLCACTAGEVQVAPEQLLSSVAESADGDEPSTADTNAANTARCGNGEIETGEVCDSGPENGDAWSLSARCNSRCDGFSPYCGDGVLQAAFETCDDGEENGDRWQTAARCNASCSGLAPHCGDGEIEAGEEICDDGIANSSTWNATPVCTSTCDGISPHCGDGSLDEGFEACDDGDDNDENSCTNACALASCGNGTPDPGEDCDAGGVNTASCDANCSVAECGDGFVNDVAGEACDGAGVETVNCNLDCTTAVCGDSVVNRAAGETCDTGGINSASCDSDCTRRECGDGVTNVAGGESCDSGGVATESCDLDCTPAECGDGVFNRAAGEECDGDAGCDSNCIIVGCGDGMPDPGEVCDDGNRLSERPDPVTDPDADYAGSSCTRDCSFDASRCHNGTLDPGEECDLGTDPGDSLGDCTRSCQSNDRSFGAACVTDVAIDGPDYTAGNITGCDNIPRDFDSDCALGCLASVSSPAGPVFFPGGYCSLYAMDCIGSPFVCSSVTAVGNVELCSCPPGTVRAAVNAAIPDAVGGVLATIRTVSCAAPCETDADCRTREFDERWGEWGQFECTETSTGSFCFDPRNKLFVPE